MAGLVSGHYGHHGRPKKRFPNEQAARAALVQIIMNRNRGKKTQGESRVYECSYCKGWHLTSQGKMPAMATAKKTAASKAAAKKTTKYLYAVQRPSGHEVVSAQVDVERVGDVEAQRLPDGTVRLVHNGDVVALGSHVVDAGEELTLHRWPANKKLEEPVSHPLPVEVPDEG